MEKHSKAERGKEGENAAVDFLRQNGYEILDRNWRAGRYELDVVACKESRLHFVEVKCRSWDGLEKPEEALTRQKTACLLRAVNAYMAMYGMDLDAQIDLAAVDRLPDGSMQVRFIPDAASIRW